MNSKLKIKSAKSPTRSVCGGLVLNFALLTFNSFASTNALTARPEPPPETARDFYNVGTRMLQEKKLREAESYLESCLARQAEPLQPAALYNLGHTRFAQGAELLKKAPNAGQAAARANNAAAQGAGAILAADNALASQEVQRMVDAYLQGRGVRRELNAALKAVRQAMQAHGEVLLRWQRAANDFRSAAELNPQDPRAKENADIVDRHIAKLIDEMRAMQQAMMAAAQIQQQLGEKLQQLRGQIPDNAMPPGAPGDGEEEEDMPDGLQPGMQEGASKSGEEQHMSREEAGEMLKGFRLDGDRRLPMGEGKEAPPKDPKRKTW
jgi:tetratricopeptide (TPR) repeat protein